MFFYHEKDNDKKEKDRKKTQNEEKDTDGDGIPDNLDECPNIYGLPQFNGCPDSDGDGIPDHKDACPFEKGNTVNNGCPSSRPQTVDTDKKTADTANLEIEMDLQIERFENYVRSQEAKKREFYNNNNQPDPVYTDNNSGNESDLNHNYRNDDNVKTASVAVPENAFKTDAKTGIAGTLYVTINNSSQFNNLIVELEAILSDLKFVKGRVMFADEQRCYEALNRIAGMCHKYETWSKLTFRLHSNNEIEGLNNVSYRNIQLSRNREEILKHLLTKRLNVSVHKLHFESSTDFAHGIASAASNYITLSIDVK